MPYMHWGFFKHWRVYLALFLLYSGRSPTVQLMGLLVFCLFVPFFLFWGLPLGLVSPCVLYIHACDRRFEPG